MQETIHALTPGYKIFFFFTPIQNALDQINCLNVKAQSNICLDEKTM